MQRNTKLLIQRFHVKPIFFLIFAIIIQIHTALFQPRISNDGLQQYLTSISLVKGHGISMPVHENHNDITDITWKPYMNWAPGWNFLIVPFILMDIHPILTYSITKALGILLLFVSIYLLLNQVLSRNKEVIIATFFLFSAFASVPTELSGATDIISLGFLFLFLYLFEKHKNNITWSKGLLIGFILFLPSFFRYAYYPISLGLALFILVWPIIIKRKVINSYILIIAVVVSLIGFQSLFMDYFTNTRGQGILAPSFSISGLFNMNPFFGQAFFPRNLIVLMLEKLGITSSQIQYILYFALSSFIALILLSGLYHSIHKNELLRINYKTQIFIVNLIVISFFIYINLKHPFRGFENYYRVIRYYALCHISIQLLIVFLSFQAKNQLIVKASRFILVFSMLLYMGHYFFLKTKNTLFNPHENLIRMVPPAGIYNDYNYIYNKIAGDEKQKIITRQIGHVLEKNRKGTDSRIHFFAALGGASFIDRDSLANFNLRSEKDYSLYILTPMDTTIQTLEKKIQKNEAKCIAELKEANFKLYKVKNHAPQ